MNRSDLADLAAFAVVAEERSFTRAAAKLGMSQSALSHSMKALEERLGIRLLARTTRSVSPTEAGERLLRTLQPALEGLSTELAALSEMREKPAGTVRITTGKHAATSILWPVLTSFMRDYPDIRIEITIDEGLTDVVAGGYDAGVRLGEQVEKDMIAVRIGPDLRAAIVGSPSYFADYPPPRTPHDLAEHNCVNYRMTKAGSLYAWEFERDGQPLKVRVNGTLVVNDSDMVIAAALEGQGLAYILDDQAEDHIAEGRLVRVLAEWCPPFPGYFLYYTSRRQTPPALSAAVEALRFPARLRS